jgi:hypothetical protein
MTERQISQDSGYSRGVVHRKLVQGRAAEEIIHAGIERQRQIAGTAAKGSNGKRGSQTLADRETYALAQARKESALASLRELELARERGSLLKRDEVASAWGSLISSAQSRLLVIPDEICDLLALEYNPIRCREMVLAKITDALSALSEYRP